MFPTEISGVSSKRHKLWHNTDNQCVGLFYDVKTLFHMTQNVYDVCQNHIQQSTKFQYISACTKSFIIQLKMTQAKKYPPLDYKLCTLMKLYWVHFLFFTTLESYRKHVVDSYYFWLWLEKFFVMFNDVKCVAGNCYWHHLWVVSLKLF